MEDFEIHVLGCTLISTVVLDASDLQSGKFPVVAEGHQWWLEAWASWERSGRLLPWFGKAPGLKWNSGH